MPAGSVSWQGHNFMYTLRHTRALRHTDTHAYSHKESRIALLGNGCVLPCSWQWLAACEKVNQCDSSNIQLTEMPLTALVQNERQSLRSRTPDSSVASIVGLISRFSDSMQ